MHARKMCNYHYSLGWLGINNNLFINYSGEVWVEIFDSFFLLHFNGYYLF
jgi:hypothetical protein